MKKKDAFTLYYQSLSQKDKNAVTKLFDSFNEHCQIHNKQKDKLKKIYKDSLLWYRKEKIPLEKALEQISPENLGSFFSRPATLWFPLDDAAKIYPIAMRKNFMATFRLSVNLTEEIVPPLLALALNFLIKRFPCFATTLKKGFFWHYLNSNKICYAVEPETFAPCKPIKISSSGSQSFKVSYYKNRINVDFFHVLTDGTGGLHFIKMLCMQYLKLRYLLEDDEIKSYLNELPSLEESENAFEKYKKKVKEKGFLDKIAVQMSGKPTRNPVKILHFSMSCNALKECAHKYGVSVTSYLLALMFISAKAATDTQTGELAIQVPVNMRKFYKSETLTNFSMYIIIRMDLQKIPSDMNNPDAEKMINSIQEQIKEKSKVENMDQMVSSAARFVKILRFIPLSLKQSVARRFYGFLGDKPFSNTLSNLGVVEFPPLYSQYIENMDFILGTGITNRACCSLITYKNTTRFSVTKYTLDPSFEERMTLLLNNDKIGFELEGGVWK